MDAMGLESGSRVTFSQITKYREQLNTEFNTAVKDGLSKLGVTDPSSVTFTLAADGSLTATSANATDQTNVQNWLKSNWQGSAYGPYRCWRQFQYICCHDC